MAIRFSFYENLIYAVLFRKRGKGKYRTRNTFSFNILKTEKRQEEETRNERYHLDRAEKIPKYAHTTGTVDVFNPRSAINGPTSRMASAYPNLHKWDAQLLNYWFSRHPAWIWSIISGVVTVLGRPGRCASQLEKSPHLNWATQFLSVTYGGAYSPNVSVRMAWIFFGALPCRKKKIDSSRLDVVEIASDSWHASFQPL